MMMGSKAIIFQTLKCWWIIIFLGLQISKTNKGIFISHTKYIKEMLKKFKIEDCKPINNLMVTDYKLRKDDESMEAHQTLHSSMIDNLIYVTTSRPNVMPKVGLVARSKYVPKETRARILKNIHISKRNIGCLLIVSKRWILHFTNIYWCILGSQY